MFTLYIPPSQKKPQQNTWLKRGEEVNVLSDIWNQDVRVLITSVGGRGGAALGCWHEMALAQTLNMWGSVRLMMDIIHGNATPSVKTPTWLRPREDEKG